MHGDSRFYLATFLLVVVVLVPLEEQLYNGPGRPLMVYASETLGPAPVWRAWVITASGSTLNHSPV
jgi:hypothetical protein